MSRIGKQPIPIPNSVTATVVDHVVSVKGPKGTLSLTLHPSVSAVLENERLTITITNPTLARERALWGLSRQLVGNMVTGVTTGFSKALELQGVGYRVQLSGKKLVFALGFSHPVEFPFPDGIEAKVEGNIVTITGIDKQVVGETAAQIRRLKKPEPYKGKGIRYVGEVVRRKAGKVAKGPTS